MSETFFIVCLVYESGRVAISGMMVDFGATGRDLGTDFSSCLNPVDLNRELLLWLSLWVIQTIQSAVVCSHHF